MSGLAKPRLLLSLVCLGLALATLWRAMPPLETAGPASQAVGEQARDRWALAGAETFLPNLDQFTETLERPLFIATRTPAIADGDGEDRATGGDDNRLILGRYRFVGSVSTGSGPLLLLRDGDNGPLLRIRAGAKLGDADVRRIDPDGLTIHRQGREQTIPLRPTDR